MTEDRKPSPAKLRLMLTALVVVAMAGLYLAAETAVRIRQWIKYGTAFEIEDTYTLDPVSGLRIPKPGGTFGPVHINSLGFRGPEIAVPKPPATLRVAFLGSSTTYCAEVSGNDAVWSNLVIQAMRRKWPALSVDYVNAGVPGFTVKNTLRNLEMRVAPLRPDIIVIYEGHNDISRNSFELAVKDGLIKERLGQELSWPSKYSLLWYLVEKNLLILRQQHTAAVVPKLKFDPETLVAPFRHDLRELVKASEKDAKLVVIATLSDRLRKEQTPEQRMQASITHLYYMPYMSTDGLIEAYASYNYAIRRVARENGALLVAGEDSIPADAQDFADSIHFTDKGSLAMADRVARGLLASDEVAKLVSQKLSRGSVRAAVHFAPRTVASRHPGK